MRSIDREMEKHHFLLVCSHAQGHMNPLLRLGRKLTSLGASVTFSTASHEHSRMFPDDGSSLPLPDPVDPLFFYHPYSDGFETRPQLSASPAEFTNRATTVGSETLYTIAAAHATADRKAVTCIIYTIFVPWVATVARRVGIPAVFFWIQPAAVFAVYYHYFHDYEVAIDEIARMKMDSDGSYRSSSVVELPGLPGLCSEDLPSLFADSAKLDEDARADHDTSFSLQWSNTILRSYKQSFRVLDEEYSAAKNDGRALPTKVLVNTFSALEVQVIQSLPNSIELVPIGPMLPPDQSAVETKGAWVDASANSTPADTGKQQPDSGDLMEWLSRWPDSSVVYISFGSFLQHGRDQVHEFAKGLTRTGRPFLWMLPDGDDNVDELKDAAGKGRTADWCHQVKVLQHPSVGCFVTHCGWNSVSEAIAAGVPMIAMPFWSDQPTNARLITATWQLGVRVKTDSEGIVRAEELQRCVELVMGNSEQGTAIRRAASEWKDMAKEEIDQGGSSDRNLKSFFNDETRP